MVAFGVNEAYDGAVCYPCTHARTNTQIHIHMYDLTVVRERTAITMRDNMCNIDHPKSDEKHTIKYLKCVYFPRLCVFVFVFICVIRFLLLMVFLLRIKTNAINFTSHVTV